jgi:trk system potassium uptake protein
MRTVPVARERGLPSPDEPLLSRLRDRLDDFAGGTPARFAILVFGLLVIVFTLLLSLPVSNAAGEWTKPVDAVFTAISVVCVTGLSTVNMADHWSAFGHVVIFVGVEIGGIGVLTLASILGLVISRRLGLRQRLMAAGDANPLRMRRGPVAENQGVRLGETGGLLLTVAVSALVIEAVAAILLFPRMLLQGVDPWDAAWQSFYWSAMAFTNTGFVPTHEGLEPYAQDPWFLGVLMLAVISGAIGFPVIYALRRGLRRPRRWPLHVKLTLTTYALLLVLGAVAFLVIEAGNPRTFGSMDAGQTVLQTLFLSTMTRSGGFSTLDMSQLDGASLLVADMLMFVGGGSASTAGGIKVTTLAILFLAAFAEARGVDDMEAFDRRIPTDVLRLAVSVVLWGATTVAASTITLLMLTNERLDYVLFDAISAFATCGLSVGFTEGTTEPAQYVLAATMLMGRIGTVTIAAAFASSRSRRLFRHAEERPIVG